MDTNNLSLEMTNSKVHISEWQKNLMTKNKDNVNAWQQEFNEVLALIKDASHNITYKAVYGDFNKGVCPYINFITLDALNKEDWPNHIGANSVFVTFEVDQIDKKVSIHSNGHVWISDKDKEIYPNDKYLAMHSMTDIAKRNGGKVMRKSYYKDAKDLANKIIIAFENIMKEVNDYTGGYPYKEGIKALRVA